MKEKSIEYNTIQEDFSRYKLEDGTFLKAKFVITRFVDSGKTDDNKNNIISMDGELMIRTEGEFEKHEPSDDIRITKDDIVKENVDFNVIEQKIQVYQIPDLNQVVLLIIEIKQISSTSKYDKIGYPVYSVKTTTKVQFVKFPN